MFSFLLETFPTDFGFSVVGSEFFSVRMPLAYAFSLRFWSRLHGALGC